MSEDSPVSTQPNDAVIALLMDVAEVGTWIWDRDTGDVWWNEWHERLLGYAPGQHQRSYDEFRQRVHPDDIDELEAAITFAIDTGQLYQHLFRVVFPDGTIRHLRGQGRVITDEPHRMVGVIVDITKAVFAAEREREYLRRLRVAEQQARLSVAADIHDGPLQRLFAAKLTAASALAAVMDVASAAEGGAASANSDRAARRIERCVESIDEAQHGLRALLAVLHSEPSIGGADLPTALLSLANDVFSGRREVVTIEYDDLPDPTAESISDATVNVVLQIGGEALLNVRKHAAASTVGISIASSAGLLDVTITDDGIGFDTTSANEPGHFGMQTMSYRAEAAGGSVTTESLAGHGTSVHLTLPLTPPPELGLSDPAPRSRRSMWSPRLRRTHHLH